MAFVHIPTHRGFTTIPSTILDDNRISMGAKGLYIQMFYSNKVINSLEDVADDLTTSTKEEIQSWFTELANIGYLVVKKDRCDLVIKTQGEKTVAKKLDEDAIKEFAEKKVEPEKTLNAYEKMVGLVTSYGQSEPVTQMLITYFERWLNKRGRFVDADDLHGYVVRAKIGELISFHLSDEDMITCIQQSIDREWFKFVPPEKKEFKAFDKSEITSGSYTEEDIRKIKERAEAMNAEGKKGTF